MRRSLRREAFMDADFLLIRKMKGGDENASNIFIRKYYKDILNYCYYHCHDKEYAEDLVQETFVRFFTKLSSYQHRGKAKNYLYTIAGNLCRDLLKKKREIPVEENDLREMTDDAAYPTEEIVNKLAVEQALLQLPNELSEVIILYYFQDQRLSEIADTLHISLSLVKYRMRQAKIQLEQLLRKEASYESGRTAYEL